MSKASDSREFRSVDVDAYDEDQYEDDTNEDTGIAAEVTQRTEQIQSLLLQKLNKDALHIILANPIITKDEAVKSQNFETVLKVLSSFRQSEVVEVVKGLSPQEVDVLMKYVYKGFTTNPALSGTLLTWHEKAFEIGGLGSIIRVMVDRQGV